MTDDTSTAADILRIDEIRERWERFDNTGDESEITDLLAENVTFLPPGSEPIIGKAAVTDTLASFPTDAYDVEHTGEDLLVSGDLAVDYVSVEGTKLNDDDSEVSLKGLDVYRREERNSWKLVFSIWNDQT